MNKLKRLFSPSALMATLATGLLLASATKAFADWYYVSTGTLNDVNQQCPTSYCHTNCADWNGGIEVYWCCDPNYISVSCPNRNDGQLRTCDPWEPPTGWCYTQ